jgi:toxin FitB
MTFLVDVNVLCEPTKQIPNPRVTDWLIANRAELVVDPIIMGEIWEGIVRLPEGKRRQNLIEWYRQSRGAIVCLPWTIETGVIWGELSNEVTQAGFTIPAEDTMISATAKLHGLTVATRNVDDFKRCGVPVFNPFE